MRVKGKVAQLCPALCDPLDYIVHKAPLSMEFSGQEYRSGLPFPSPENLPNPRILEYVAIPFSRESSQSRDPGLLHWQAESLLSEPPGKPILYI